jgi:hypothetical protein
MAFLTAANAEPTWTEVITHLQGFFDDGHEPFGANQHFADWAFGGPGHATDTHGRHNFEIRDRHLNYFCNGHTYRHLNFAERADRAAVSMFPVGWGKTQVAAALRSVLRNNAVAVDAMASRSIGGFINGTFRDGSSFEIGVTTRDDYGTLVARVDHFQPTGNIMSASELAAITHLFR